MSSFPGVELLIGITCYNCENQVSLVLSDIRQARALLPNKTAVLIIDNSSADKTRERASEAAQNFPSELKIVKNEKNIGLGGSQIRLFNYAKENDFSHLIVLHGDNQASALEIIKLLKQSNEQSQASVLGSRFMNLALLSGYSKFREYGNRILNKIYSIFLKIKICDLGSGLNLYRVSDFDIAELRSLSVGFDFNMQLLLFMIRKKIRFSFIPISWRVRDEKSNAKAISVGGRALWALVGHLKTRSD